LVQHPLRRWILAGARHPVSATELALALGLTRQRVNYHVRQLVKAGYLRPAGRRKKRNLVERQYVATARAYVLSPQMLGPLAATAPEGADATSPWCLLGLTSLAQQELATVAERSSRAGAPAASESLMTELLFEDAGQRAEFARALRKAVAGVLAEHSAPYQAGAQSAGGAYRLVMGCYPIPEPHDSSKR
jgi:biotin operon repressor